MFRIFYSIYQFLIRVLFGQKFIVTNLYNEKFFIRFQPSYNLNFKPFLKIQSYENILHSNVENIIIHKLLIRRNSALIIYDIGANIGQSLIWFKRIYPDAKIIALEPDPSAYENLSFNVRLNKFHDVVTINKGVASRNGNLKFFIDSVSGGRRSSFERSFVGSTFKGITKTIEVTTLNHLIGVYGKPDIIKIDVEGLEEDVLRGITDIEGIIFLIEIRSSTSSYVFDLFKDDFNIYLVDKIVSKVFSEKEINTFCNILCIPK